MIVDGNVKDRAGVEEDCGDDSCADDNDDDDNNDVYGYAAQVDGAQKQLVGSLGAIERMLGIITEKLQVRTLSAHVCLNQKEDFYLFIRELVKNYLADFFSIYWGSPPPLPSLPP